MPGLRNSGIDTSAWYLAGYSGTELLVNDPRLIDPTAVFGGNLGTATPIPLLFDLRATVPQVAPATIGIPTAIVGAWSPAVAWVAGNEGGMNPLPVGGGSVAFIPVDTPVSYDPVTGVPDGFWCLGNIFNASGSYRSDFNNGSMWTEFNIAASVAGSNGVDPSDATVSGWDATPNVGNAQHCYRTVNALTPATGAIPTTTQVVVRQKHPTATHAYIRIVDLDTPVDFAGVILEFATGNLTPLIGGLGTVVDSKALRLPNGHFLLQLAVKWASASGGGCRCEVGPTTSNSSYEFAAVGTEVVNFKWFGLSEASNSRLTPTFNYSAFGSTDGAVRPTTFTLDTPLSLPGPAGFTVAFEFTLYSRIFSADAQLRFTPLVFIGNGGGIIDVYASLQYVASTNVWSAVYQASSTVVGQIPWTPAVGVKQRVVFRCNSNDFSLHINGVEVGTDLTGTLQATNTFSSGGSSKANGLTPAMRMHRWTMMSLMTKAQATALSASGW